ncbi:hypothetical protein [Haloferula sargassicola]|uniref:Uncharacterized protein n=1 Tax=Haloferula sargassicola TaxID=490096 RepID=A0ABP9USC2_9BACT
MRSDRFFGMLGLVASLVWNLTRRPAAGGLGAVLRWLGVLLLALAWLPSCVGGVLVMFPGSGGHEVRCSFDQQGGLMLTLHHPDKAVLLRHHTFLEDLAVGRSEQDHEDHHLAIGGGNKPLPPVAATREAGSSPVRLADAAVAPVPVTPAPATRRTLFPRSDGSRAGPPPWRGGVMRI